MTGIYTHSYDLGLSQKSGFPVFGTLIEANYIQKRQDQFSVHRLTDDDRREILALARDPQVLGGVLYRIMCLCSYKSSFRWNRSSVTPYRAAVPPLSLVERWSIPGQFHFPGDNSSNGIASNEGGAQSAQNVVRSCVRALFAAEQFGVCFIYLRSVVFYQNDA